MKNKGLFTLLASLGLLALLAGLLGAAAAPVLAAGFVVDTDSDAHDADLGNGVCDTSGGACTLRAAIEEANYQGGAHTITFAYPMDISLDTTLGVPDITTQIRLDASGVWDTADDEPGVSINGVDQSIPCIQIHGTNAEIYGLYIHNCGEALAIFSSYNTVGGPLAGQRNVLSGNLCAVYLGGDDVHHNVIQGNWIGLTPGGDSTAANDMGMQIAGGAHDNTIGGATAAHGNYISGNTMGGVIIAGSDGNRLGGNVIGMLAVGSGAAGNGVSGVYISATSTQIGGSGLASNTIAFSDEDGVAIVGNNNTVEDNEIVSNGESGVSMCFGASNNLVQSNHIAYNSRDGVYVAGDTSIGNSILTNGIHDNDEQGIDLFNGGNHELAAPIIAAANTSDASGTACAGCTVQLFSDYADEGYMYLGSATADGSGNWSYSGFLFGPNVTATATNTGGDTSEFSAPVPVESPCIPISDVAISGPTSGLASMPYTFHAGVTPPDASEPITYTWSPAPNSGQGSAHATYTWGSPGWYSVMVEVSNCGSPGVLYDTHQITITAGTVYRVYLPTVARHHGP